MELFETGRSDEAAGVDEQTARKASHSEPLASRMRPARLQDFVGQGHLLGPDGFLRRAIELENQGGSAFGNMILWGPPGTGKTTLALLLANASMRPFLKLSAVLDGLKELRSCLNQAEHLGHRAPILFIDEIHRWNKSQQDALLPWVEQGTVLLVGATTENPAFELNNALLSRVRILQLAPLSCDELRSILQRTILGDREHGTKDGKQGEKTGLERLELSTTAQQYLLEHSGGDARRLLNALELLALSRQDICQTAAASKQALGQALDARRKIEKEEVQQILQQQSLYDRNGDYHYDCISAFIKSVRGSAVDEALYWLQVMLQGGESPHFLWRRLLILAAEDVGLADPQALVQVQAAAQAFEYVGLPEGEYFLSQATIYLALAPKSNSVGAFHRAKDWLNKHGAIPVPGYLRSQPKSGHKRAALHDAQAELGAGSQGPPYHYPHDYRGNWIEQDYTGFSLRLYHPGILGWEAQAGAAYERRQELLQEARHMEQGLAQQHLNSAGFWHNRHELLLLWDELRQKLAHAAQLRGWSSLEYRSLQEDQPSADFLQQEWRRQQNWAQEEGRNSKLGEGQKESPAGKHAPTHGEIAGGMNALILTNWNHNKRNVGDVKNLLSDILGEERGRTVLLLEEWPCHPEGQQLLQLPHTTPKRPETFYLQWQLRYRQLLHDRLWQGYGRKLPADLPEELQATWRALKGEYCQLTKYYSLFFLN